MANLDKLDKELQKLEQALDRIEKKMGASGSADSGASSPAFDAWNQLCQEFFAPLTQSANSVGGDAMECHIAFEKVITECGKLILKAGNTKKPSDNDLGKFVADLSNAMNECSNFKNKKPRSDQINYLKAYDEAAQTFVWVIQQLPAPFVEQGKGSTEFWSNKILVANKGKDETQAGWARNISAFLKELQVYTKQWHTQGLKYKP